MRISWLAGAALALALLLAGHLARDSWFTGMDSQRIDWPEASYRIEPRHAAEAELYDLRRVGSEAVEMTIGGSTDLLCERSSLARFDADGDGRRDLFLLHCGGCRLVSYLPAEGGLVERPLPDHACWPDTVWAGEIRRHGWRASALGAGVLSLLVWSVGRSTRRARRAHRIAPASVVRGG